MRNVVSGLVRQVALVKISVTIRHVYHFLVVGQLIVILLGKLLQQGDISCKISVSKWLSKVSSSVNDSVLF